MKITINLNSEAPEESVVEQTDTVEQTSNTIPIIFIQIVLIGIVLLVLNPNLGIDLLVGIKTAIDLPTSSSTEDSTPKQSTDSKLKPETEPEPKPKPTAPSTSNQLKDYDRFLRTLENVILPIEGGCSDHKNDKGGRTFMGITYKTGEAWGWTDDICKMPVEKVYEIYYHGYWVKSGAIDQKSEAVAVALFDVGVNSGPGKAEQFLNKAPGSLKGKKLALWITGKQRENYGGIVKRDSTQKDFWRGWIYRNNEVKKYIENLP